MYVDPTGFHLCVLIVHLSEHLPREKRLLQFKTSSQVLTLGADYPRNIALTSSL